MSGPGVANVGDHGVAAGRARKVLEETGSLALVAASFAYALAVGWRKWGELLFDTARELDIPRRMLQGERLYSDLRFYYGPLAPYVNAALYSAFGVHVDVLMWSGIASAALTALVLYGISRQFLGRWQSAVIAAAFVHVCAFAHLYVNPSFNFALPYTYAATYGILAALGSLHFLVVHARTANRRALFASTMLLALAALAKMEVLFPAAVAHVAFVATSVRRHNAKLAFAAYGVAGGVVGSVYGALALQAGDALSWSMGGLVNSSMRTWALHVIGADDLGGALRSGALSATALVAVIAVAAAAGRLLGAARSTRVHAAIIGSVSAGTFALYAVLDPRIPFRSLPAVAIAAITALGVQWWRAEHRRAMVTSELLVWTFAAASLGRILLNSMPHHYGFFLLPPGLVAVGLLFRELSRVFSRSGSAVFAGAAVGLLAGAAVSVTRLSNDMYARHVVELSTERGTLFVQPDDPIVPFLEVLFSLPRGARVVAVPVGSAAMYFADLRPGDRMFSYLPMELPGDADDHALRSQWAAAPPDFIIWQDAPMDEFGFRGFGLDYARSSFAWLRETYEPLTDPRGNLVVLRQKRFGASAMPTRTKSGQPGG